MSTPVASIVIPHFNQAAYLAETVNSAVSQDQPVEVLVVDDGSTDPDVDALLRRLESDGVRVLRKSNGGTASALNHGIAEAKASYILPLGADDRIEPGYTRKAVAVLEEDSGIGGVTCQAHFFGKRTGPWNLPEPTIENMLRGNSLHAVSFFRKHDWERLGGFTTEIRYREDYDFWLGMLELGLRLHRIPEVLFHYRKHTTWYHSKSRRLARLREVDTMYQIRQRHAKLYALHPEILLEMHHDEASTRARLQDARLGFRLRAWLRRRHMDT